MKASDAFLLPGTLVCRRLGVDPEADAGLIRWMFNTIFYFVLTMIFVWIFVI